MVLRVFPRLRLPLIHEVFSDGNDKLGDRVLSFSLPAVRTCPGSSQRCRDLCYADRPQSRFSSPTVQACYQRNLAFSRRADFARVVTALLARTTRKALLVRLHVSGDFYNRAYVRKWLRVVKATPRATFWCYTRSWRVPEIRPVLEELGALPNMHLWYSYDLETGAPENYGPRIRTAYMRVEEDDQPDKDPDLYFREHVLRKKVEKHVAGTLVCPPENGASKQVQCLTCRVCFTDPVADPARRTRGRFLMNLV